MKKLTRLTDEEIVALREQDPQLVWEYVYETGPYLLFKIKRILPRIATQEDVEDCFQKFSCDGLPRLIIHFDPNKGSFAPYVESCLKRLCWTEGKKISYRAQRELPLIPFKQSEEGDLIEPDFADPFQEGQDKSLDRTEKAAILREAIADLNEKDRELILLSLEDKTDLEIAQQLEVSRNCVRTRLCRARRRLRELLIKRMRKLRFR